MAIKLISSSLNDDAAQRLLEQESVLQRAIYETCIQKPETGIHSRCPEIAAKTFCVICSAIAKIPYISIAFRLPHGWMFAVGNSSSFFLLEYWAIRATINDLFGAKSKREILLLNRNGRGRCFQIATLTSAMTVALLSQVPVALPALDYNGKYKYPAMIILLVAGSLIPVRSLQLSIDEALKMKACVLQEAEKKVEQVRKDLIALVGEYGDLFRKADLADKLQMIRSLAQLKEEDSVDTVNDYLSIILKETDNPSVSKISCIFGKIAQVSGLVLTASFQTALAMYTYAKSKEYIIDNDIVAGTFAATTVICWTYLSGQSVINRTQQFVSTFINAIQCRGEATLAEQMHAKLTLSLKLVGVLINLAALGPSLVIYGDFYENHPDEKLYFQITICATLFLLLSTATMETIDETVEYFVLKKGSENYKQIIELKRDLRKLQELVQRSSLLDFSVFLFHLPQKLKTGFLNKVGLQMDELSAIVGE